MSDWNSYEALLTEGYRQCAKLTWRYGTTYFWGAALLAKPQRKHVHAIYALCRLADDIVDLPSAPADLGAWTGSAHLSENAGASTSSAHSLNNSRASTGSPHISPVDMSGPDVPPEPEPTLLDPEPIGHELDDEGLDSDASTSSAHTSSSHISTVGRRLEAFAEEFRISLAAGGNDDPVMAAIVHTVITCRIPREHFDRFFGAMAMDLTTTSYETWEDLRTYMEGSAAVIGEMMLPVLEPIGRAARAPARSLGLAFQLTNFLRDIDEDLDRGRVYLPQDDLRLFEVDVGRRTVTPEWRAFLAYEIERNRALYSFADTGIAMLPPRSARCVGTARMLYAQILDEIERNGYDVFSQRARVPTPRKAATAARIMVTGPRTLKRQAELYLRRSTTDVTQDT
jgi:15-cis-phytoene synthase